MRIVNIITSLVLIIASGIYSLWYSSRHMFTLKDYLIDEEKWDGSSVAANYQKVIDIGEGYFVVAAGGKKIRVMSNLEGINPGNIVSFKGIFEKGPVVNAERCYISKYRKTKYLVSFIACVLAAVYFLINYKFNAEKVFFEKR